MSKVVWHIVLALALLPSCLMFRTNLSSEALKTMRFAKDLKPHGELEPLRVAVVGGGPSGLALVLSLIKLWAVRHVSDPRIILDLHVFEKRFTPSLARTGVGRLQRVFMPWHLLQEDSDTCKTIQPEHLQESLLIEMGEDGESALTVPIGTIELSILRLLRTLLTSTAMPSNVKFDLDGHWHQQEFTEQNATEFHHVVGCDGKRSFVRRELMKKAAMAMPGARPLQNATIRLLTYHYDHRLQWDEDDSLFALSNPAPRPIIAYFDVDDVTRLPEYWLIEDVLYERLLRFFRNRAREAASNLAVPNPWSTPWSNLDDFVQHFDHETQQMILHAKDEEAEDIDDTHKAIIVPVMLQVHRSPWLTLPTPDGPRLWLLGDSAVGLSISSGCNIMYHLRSSQKLAEVIVYGRDPQAYERYVIQNWEEVTWRTTGSECILGKSCCGIVDELTDQLGERAKVLELAHTINSGDRKSVV